MAIRVHLPGILLLVFCSGCGPQLVEVKGNVTFNGEAPGEEGCKIVFKGSAGETATAAISAKGDYQAKNVVVGPNQVAVFYSDPSKLSSRERRERGFPSVTSNSPLAKIPLKYADVTTSGLKLTVAPGTEFSPKLEGPENP